MMVGCCSAVYGAPRPGTGMKRRAHGIGRHFALFIDLILLHLTLLSICMHLHDAVAYGLGCARVSCSVVLHSFLRALPGPTLFL